MMNEGLYKKIRISRIQEEFRGFRTIEFEEGHGIRYEAGQYLTLVLEVAGEEHRRSYSITSSPVLLEPLRIGVKRVDNGLFSRLLVDHAQPGDEWITTGAGGFFTLPENVADYGQVFYFAAGAGITPVFSLLKSALHTYPHLENVLVYSNASPEKAAFLQPLRGFKEIFKEQFHPEFLFSNTADLSKARLYRDLLLQLLKKHCSLPFEKVLFYICGPEAYMRMSTYVLQEQGVPKENIRKENFVIAKKPFFPKPPDESTYQVRVTIGNDTYSFPVHYPDSILKAAKKASVVMPYSCEAGRCGNCVARCTSGTVWHAYNEVLTEKELGAGMILTCVGHPVGGDLELHL